MGDKKPTSKTSVSVLFNVLKELVSLILVYLSTKDRFWASSGEDLLFHPGSEVGTKSAQYHALQGLGILAAGWPPWVAPVALWGPVLYAQDTHRITYCLLG